jgi:hypothetical protein
MLLKLKRRFFLITSKHPIPMLKKLSLVGLLSVAGLLSNSALAEGWVGYLNCFNTGSGTSGSDYIFGSSWGLSDLKTTVLTSNTGTIVGDQLRLEPNYNTYNSTDAFWSNGSGGGNKFLELNTFVETASISTASVSFSGTIDSYTLSNDFTAIAFIKVLDPNNGYSLDLFKFVNLNSGSQFSVDANLSGQAGKILQLGYAVYGINANPANAVANGSVVVTAVPEPSSFALIGAAIAGLFAVTSRRRRA